MSFSTNFRINSILLTGLEFNCTVRDFLCLSHLVLIDLNVIRNCIQILVLIIKVNGKLIFEAYLRN